MSSALRTRQPHEALPPEIYIPLVDSLFKEGQALFVGIYLCHRFGSHHILEDRRAPDPVLRDRDLCRRVRAGNHDAHVSCADAPSVTTAEVARRWEYRYSIGASVILALLGHLVFRRIFADERSVRPPRQLHDDARLCCGHLRQQFRQSAVCDHANPLHVDADDGGAAALRQSVSLDFRHAADPDFLRDQADRRKAARHTARRGCHLARHVAAGEAVRHRAEQHAARPVHVRLPPPHRGREPEAQAANRTGARISNSRA